MATVKLAWRKELQKVVIATTSEITVTKYHKGLFFKYNYSYNRIEVYHNMKTELHFDLNGNKTYKILSVATKKVNKTKQGNFNYI